MKRPILNIVLAFAAGIILSSFLLFPIIYPVALSAVFLILSSLLFRNDRIAHITLYLALIFLGAAYNANHRILPPDHISAYSSEEPKKVFLKGVVRDDPAVGVNSYGQDRAVFLLSLEAISEGDVWKKACGYVRVVSYSDTGKLNYGDDVVIGGMLSRPEGLKNPGVFDYSRYLRIKDIYSFLKTGPHDTVKVLKPASLFSIPGIAYKLRHWARISIESYFDRRHAGFLKSIVIGDRAQLEEGINEDFIRTGTVHVLAISGLNVGFVAAIFLSIFGLMRIPRKINLVLTLALLVFYMFVTGANPPIVRAVIMFGIFAAGYILNRDADPLNTLSLAALIILLQNPNELFDPSFQLSFASVASIIIFAPPMIKAVRPGGEKLRRLPQRLKFYVLASAAVSAAAWVGSAPLTAAYFNIISPVSFLANLVIVPALSLLTGLSFLFLALAPLSGYLGHLLSYVISATDNIVFFANHVMASMPLAYFRVPSPPAYLSVLFYLTALLVFLPKKKYLILAALLLCNLAVWPMALPGEKNLEITFLDVGQGDSIYVKTPSGANILVDGSTGGQEGRFDMGRAVIAPYLWNKGVFRIDLLVVTHFHEDHLGGLIYVLKNFDIGCVMDNGIVSLDQKLYRTYLKAIKDRRIKHISAQRGDMIRGFGGIDIYVLNPDPEIADTDSNDNSLVIKLVYKDFGALLCGDITEKAIEKLAQYPGYLKSDVVKVPHHGGVLGDRTKIKYFFEALSSRAAVISVGRHNRYGMPSEKTEGAILSSGAALYETKDSGAVTIKVKDNGRIRVEEFVRIN